MRIKNLLYDTQVFEGQTYSVVDLIEASKNLEVIEIKVADMFIEYPAPCEDSLTDFIEHYIRTKETDLSYPVILSLGNFILDGKHRLIKAIVSKKETIKAVRFKILPDCGEYIDK